MSAPPLLERIGIPPTLKWGFVGLLVFMIGDGVETGYLSAFLVQEQGFSEGRVALIFTIYGITAAAAYWFSAALSDIWGPRRVMFLGAGIWIAFHVLFVAGGIMAHNYPLLLVSYAIRGFGYPLFGYAFLVWITASTETRRLGTAAGWFWFAYSAGFAALGPQLANLAIPLIGQLGTLWLGLAVIVLGALLMLLVRDPNGDRPTSAVDEKPLRSLLAGLTILWQRPRMTAGMLVRMINSIPQYGFIVFMPIFYTRELGFTLSQWLTVSSVMFVSNIFFNLVSGILGDRFGFAVVVRWMGGVGCAVTTLLFHYLPLTTHSYAAALITSVLYGATLAGFVPMSALMPTMAPDRRGAAMAALNLGAGLATAVGPAIVGITLPLFGVGGVMWVFAALYVVAALLTLVLKVPSPQAAEQVRA
ncbi:MFS transporter [Saccharopolyspora hirsuta]|uniref:MFS transporter n=1 Tax=Saccharopolyspora hirsuta TaxID=1837 RepID=A0A5M7BRU9_SACHI|nr:MFS transporter [Saccharopolyspora hirsuta]KAA5832499.1 MFS transporter [Saccharopolyspora hirsuta]